MAFNKPLGEMSEDVMIAAYIADTHTHEPCTASSFLNCKLIVLSHCFGFSTHQVFGRAQSLQPIQGQEVS